MGLGGLQKDLRDGMSIEEGLKKHNMTLKEIFNQNQHKKRALTPSSHKGSIRKTRRNPPHYGVCKMIRGKLHWYGVYHTKEEAEIIRERLHQVNWDKNELDNILKETGIKRAKQNERKVGKNTYIYDNGHGHYSVAKSMNINGKRKAVLCGTYTTIDEARIIRDEMLKNNWDNTNLDELCKKHHITRRTPKG